MLNDVMPSVVVIHGHGIVDGKGSLDEEIGAEELGAEDCGGVRGIVARDAEEQCRDAPETLQDLNKEGLSGTGGPGP